MKKKELIELLKKECKNHDDLIFSSLYSSLLLRENIEDLSPISKLNDEDFIEIQVGSINNISLNLKIIENLLKQSCYNQFSSIKDFIEYKKINNMNIDSSDFHELKNKPHLYLLVDLQKKLIKNNHLINDDFIKFTEFLENGNIDNAKHQLTKLKKEQINIIPNDIIDFIK